MTQETTQIETAWTRVAGSLLELALVGLEQGYPPSVALGVAGLQRPSQDPPARLAQQAIEKALQGEPTATVDKEVLRRAIDVVAAGGVTLDASRYLARLEIEAILESREPISNGDPGRDAFEQIKHMLDSARESGWTDRALADRLLVSAQTVLRWRLGRVRPDAPMVLSMALHSLLRSEEAPPRRKPGPRPQRD